MNEQELQKLADLARITIAREELKKIHTDMDAILKYISQIQEVVDMGNDTEKGEYAAPILREDARPHEGGIYTDDLLNSAPRTKDGYVRVKKILPI